MNAALMVVDDFAHNAEEIREKALELPYDAMEHGGVIYPGIGIGYDPRITVQVERAVGFPVAIRLGFFRIGMRDIRMNTYIHADNAESEFAGVLHLSKSPVGGTAFWKHRQSGVTEAPNDLGFIDADALAADGFYESKWEMESKVGARFNRFVCYPARCFHSRYPNQCDAETKQDGRLVYAAFFDRK